MQSPLSKAIQIVDLLKFFDFDNLYARVGFRL